MKNFTLGLDLGTNSIGWAVVEHDNKEPIGLIACGSRIFQEAVDAKQEHLKTKPVAMHALCEGSFQDRRCGEIIFSTFW